MMGFGVRETFVHVEYPGVGHASEEPQVRK
jgi:hypothetical protein